jgi:hypothetical protein
MRQRVELSLRCVAPPVVGSAALLRCYCYLRDCCCFPFVFLGSRSLLCFLLLLCFVGYCLLLAFYWFDPLVETFVTRFVLVPLFYSPEFKL